MTIKFHCEHCGKAISAPDDTGGRKGKCPSCQQPCYIPMPEEKIDEIPVAPVDPEEEERMRRLRLESIAAQTELERHKESAGAPATPTTSPESVLPIYDGDKSSPAPSSGEDIETMVQQYILAMAQGQLDKAEALVDRLARNTEQAGKTITAMAKSKTAHPMLKDIPDKVIRKFYKQLAKQVSKR